MRPLLFLDVDGVLFVDDERLLAAPRTAQLRPRVNGRHANVQVFYDRAIAQRMAELLAHVDLVWATSWEDNAPRLVAELTGFGSDAAWLDSFGHQRLSDWDGTIWKHSALAQFLAADFRPFIWVDDVVLRSYDTAAAAAEQLAGDLDVGVDAVPPFLLVRPDPTVGLSDSDIRDAAHFARGTLVEPSSPGTLWYPGR